MKSINTKYIPELDHLRFYASMMIVFFHLLGGEIVHYLHLDIGIPLFFTLSGFLFFTIAKNANKEIIYWKFIYNRFLRIYPMIIFLFFLSIVLMKKFTAIDFINLFGLNYPGNGVTSWIAGDWGYQYLSFNWWTVGVEFTFYLIFPFLYKFYKETGVKYLLSLLCLIILFRYGLYYTFLEEYGWKNLAINLNYSVLGNFDMFMIGMLGGHIFNKISYNAFCIKVLSSKLLFIIYLSLMWWFLINHIDNYTSTSTPVILSSLCVGLIISYTLAFRNSSKFFIGKRLASLGSISFSIYLLHSFVKDAMVAMGIDKIFLEKLHFLHLNACLSAILLIVFLYIPTIIAISYLTYNTIEEPFLRMRVKYFK